MKNILYYNCYLVGCSIFFMLQMAKAGTVAPSSSASHNIFATNLYQILAPSKQQDNVIFSPASIQTCLALAFMGARGKTADELRQGLVLGKEIDQKSIAENYRNFLTTNFGGQTAQGPQLKMANRIYVNDQLQINSQFQTLAEENFGAKAEQVNFGNAAATAQNINSWVEGQTEKKIRNLIQPNILTSDTSSILVNAIYFKGKWATPFSASNTKKSSFTSNGNSKSMVDMMFADEKFKYTELNDLNAKAIEMPYENSELSMLLILPNNVDGLQQLEQKLSNIDLNQISSSMSVEDVEVYLPRFHIENEFDLKMPLQKLGIASVFNNDADLSGLFDNTNVPQKISEVRHKAFLDVNEAGSEAAAATFLKFIPMSLNFNQKTFKADHPFVYAIRSKTAVFFAGHVAKL